VGWLLLSLGLVAAVAVERLVELRLSERNARRALSRGGAEHGRRHYPVMVALHTALLAACAGEALLSPAPPPAAAWLAVAGVGLAQAPATSTIRLRSSAKDSRAL
jgi:methyltransferase